jgi:hypothetical protein
MTQVSAQAVQDQTRRAIQQRIGITPGREYVEADYSFTCAVAKALGIEYNDRQQGGGYDWKRLEGQVKRALDKLADDQHVQLVIRVKPGERTPDGFKPRWTRYYIPEAHAAIKAAYDAKRQQHADTRSRWAEVTDKLSRVVGPVTKDHVGRPVLTLEQYQEILESLVAGPGQEG